MGSMLYLKLAEIGLEDSKRFWRKWQRALWLTKKVWRWRIGGIILNNIREMSETLNVNKSTVSKHVKAMGMIQKLGNWIPHELREGDIAKCLAIELLLQRQKLFLSEIIFALNYDWWKMNYDYDNWSAKNHGCEPANHQLQNRIFMKRKSCCVFDGIKIGVVYYELLQPNQTINAEHYCQLLNYFSITQVIFH